MRALRTVLTFASLLIFGLPAVAAAEPTKVAIGYPPATDFLAAYVAKEQGIFDKHNIDATLVKIPVVTNIPSAVVSGSIQIGMTTIPVVLQADDGGLDLVLVAGAARHTKEHPFISLLARSDIKYDETCRSDRKDGRRAGHQQRYRRDVPQMARSTITCRLTR